jgi:hypothetical protein
MSRVTWSGCVWLETVREDRIWCYGVNGKGKEAFIAEGEITGPKTSRLFNVVLHGCEFIETSYCGPIGLSELNGVLGVQKFGETPAKNKIANWLAPASGEIIAEPDCRGLAVVIKGSILNPVTVNAMKLTATVKWSQHNGKQKPERFATDLMETKRVLSMDKYGGPFFQTGLSLTTIQTNEEKLEMSTVN